jgi:hypothetical protein
MIIIAFFLYFFKSSPGKNSKPGRRAVYPDVKKVGHAQKKNIKFSGSQTKIIKFLPVVF